MSVYGPDINSGNTTCQPTHKPSIQTCDAEVIGPNDNKKRAVSIGASTTCENLQDMYGNFQPTVMRFNMVSDLVIDATSSIKPAFIVESNFGISDSSIRINKLAVDGKCFTLVVFNDEHINELYCLQNNNIRTI